MEPSKTSREIVSEAMNELGIPVISEGMPASADRDHILLRLTPDFAKSQRLSPDEVEKFKEMVKAAYKGDKRKVKEIDAQHDFVSYLMGDIEDRKVPKFPISFFRMVGGPRLESDALDNNLSSD